ncbi:MAG: aminoacyl-tRNA hydrolase [Flavobacteriales bacterium]|nr:aminoacyl-tRNA hydrolase [Flavobacteriales bacterium]
MKYLIVGLGNPGLEYTGTRHNIGFEILDALAGASNISFKTERYGDVAELKHKGRSLILLKPNTYMNLSGKAVRYWMDKEKVPAERMLVVTDDLALPYGTIRIRKKGSDGGHNGLKNIQALINTTKYPRFRFGISAEFSKGHQVNYVLGKWNEEESSRLGERLDRSCQAILSFASIGLDRTMNFFNNT